ncbi:uncharacterized protein LOC110239882 [Exaiptasia diaphana]|uniref:THAP-type domain-containing protein n=1 Tax=Exaiptasia diaphana TaxID=2652724 RepID=A0A913YLG7_EXADI|nr:uncharacterized protein LOC110239882 [Exaiptasia diaphana]
MADDEADDTMEFNQSFSGNVAQKKRKIGHKCCAASKCNNRSDNRPDLSFHSFPKDDEVRKKWDIAMKRDDKEFKHVNSKFCCSAHFMSSDFKFSITGHKREIKKGSIPSVFEWKTAEMCTERGERVASRNQQTESKAKDRLLRQFKDSLAIDNLMLPIEEEVVYGPLTLEECVNSLQEEVKKLDIAKLLKEKEAISKFGLERFPGSDEDINFYTGFPNSESLMKLWEHIESDSSHLTYYSYVRDRTEPNSDNCFPYLNKKKPGNFQMMVLELTVP